MKAENLYKYTSLKRLKKIEERLLEIEHEKSSRKHNLNEEYPGDIEYHVEIEGLEYLDIERNQLILKRQFILDNRESRKSKIILIIITAIITLTVSYIAKKLGIGL